MLPIQVKVGGLMLAVRFDPLLGSDRDRFGEVSVMRNIITIDANLAPDRQELTLLHEIIETINSCCDLDLAHGQISTLSTMLHQVLKDNGLGFAHRGE